MYIRSIFVLLISINGIPIAQGHVSPSGAPSDDNLISYHVEMLLK